MGLMITKPDKWEGWGNGARRYSLRLYLTRGVTINRSISFVLSKGYKAYLWVGPEKGECFGWTDDDGLARFAAALYKATHRRKKRGKR